MDFNYDFMEMGESGLVALGQGWIHDTKTGNKRSPEGHIFNKEGEMIFRAEDISEDQDEEDT